MAYHLKLPYRMKQLHPVFNVVKLTPAPDNPIMGCKTEDHPLPIVINGEAEWEVEEVLDSRWHWRRFQYLIKWKGYGREHNSRTNSGVPSQTPWSSETCPTCGVRQHFSF